MARKQIRDPKQRAAYAQTQIKFRRENGICISCGIAARPLEGCVRCLVCRERAKKWQAANKAKGACYCGRKRKKNYSLCPVCLKSQRKSQAIHLANQSEEYKQKQYQLKRILHQKLKAEVFMAYGNKCACCGEDNPGFLQIDHIFGNGCKHRKEIKQAGGVAFHRWLKNKGFPKKEFQLLCANCNWGKRLTGICPHFVAA